ncbi:MAG: protein kinase [Anaerolineae bacterium]|nr:protein kinase [Anaerolineae bacterium]
MGPRLEIQTLGGVTVTCDETRVEFGQRKTLALLVYLAYHPHPHPREVLAEMLWEDRTQAQSLANLRVVLTDLRQAVKPFMCITRETAGIDPDSDIALDVTVFEHMLDEAVADVSRLATGVEMYQGDFLAGFYIDSSAFETWATRERERLKLRVMDAFDSLISGDRDLGDYQAGLARAARLLALDPLREETHRQIMELLWRSGQRAKALEQYDQCRQVLADELGVEPAPAMTELYELIRTGETPERADQPPPIRGYAIRERIGAGGFGEVYRAWQPVVNREVAIKIIRPEYANHPDFIRRFETEAQLVARLEHPHIVPLYDYWREPDGAFLVMRYLRGGSLRQRLDNGPLSFDDCAHLVEHVAGALTVAHQQGIVHRDLKPANILLDDAGNAYLCDFGIAKVLDPAVRATQEGALVGSPAYLSPEQIRSEQVTPGSDIYSFGILLYETLTGQPPFSNALTPSALLYSQLNEPLPSLLDLCPDLPPGLDTVVQRATAKDPLDRYRDVQGLAAAFRAAGGDAVAELPAIPYTLPESAIALMVQRNPYKGLRPFTEADADDFFGRETAVDHLLARLEEDTGEFGRFLAVVGPSGCGKSSVVRAGLLPALRAGRLPGAEEWFVAGMLPGAHPLEEIDIALTRVAAAPDLNLLPVLRDDERGLLRAVRRVLPNDATLLLVIDQFEEVFTLVDDPAEARFFMDSLYAAVTDLRSPLRIVITLRADFYDRPLMHPDFSQLVRQRTEAIVPMMAEEVERAVSLPAESVGVKLEPGLTAAITAEVHEQPGALPMLQYALTELFDHATDHVLTLDAYQAVGGVQGALARRAGEVYGSLTPDQQHVARQLFLRLVTLGEGVEDTRRRALQAELLSVSGETMQAVIDVFDRARLLTFDHDPVTRGPTVEVAHEAILREWDLLRAWLDESRNDIRLQRMLATAATEWQHAGQETSYLLSGARLAQFEEWAAHTTLALTQEERDFLAESTSEDRRRKAVQRRVRNTVLAAAVVIAVVMGALALLASDREQQAQQAREQALSARATSDYNAEVAVANAAEARELALVNGARAALVSGDLDTALALAVTANQSDTPSAEAQTILSEAAYQPGTIRRLVGDRLGIIMTIAVSPDGQTALSGGEAGKTTCWDLNTGKVIYDLQGHDPAGIVLDVDISPDGRTGVSIAEDQSIILWDLKTGEMIRRFGEDHILSPHSLSVAFSPDGQTVLSNNGGRSVLAEFPEDEEANLILWDVSTGEPVRTFHGHTAITGRLAISPDGKTALSGAWGGELILWDMATGEAIQQFGEISEMPFKLPSDIKYMPDGGHALVLYADNTIILWDLETFEALQHYGEPGGFNGYAEFDISPDGRLMLMPSFEDKLVILDVETGATIMPLPGYNTGAAFMRDGRAVLVGMVSELRLLAIQYGAEVRQFSTDFPPLLATLSPDGRTLFVAIDNGFEMEDARECAIVLFDVESGQETQRFGLDTPLIRELGCPVTSLALSPDGHTALVGGGRAIAKAGSEGPAVLWDVTTGEVLHILEGPSGGFSAVVFSPDGQTALTGGRNEFTVILWDVESGQEIRRLTGHTNTVWRVVFSPDGQTALSSGQDGLVILWNLATGEAIHELEGHVGGANDVGFSPDGSTALSIGDDGRLILWDLKTGQLVMSLEAEASSGVEFSPDGRYALTSGGRNSVWDLTTGSEVRRYSTDWWHQLNLSLDAETFFVIGPDDHVHQWRIDWGADLLTWTLDHRYVRDLTCEERAQYHIEPLCE